MAKTDKAETNKALLRIAKRTLGLDISPAHEVDGWTGRGGRDEWMRNDESGSGAEFTEVGLADLQRALRAAYEAGQRKGTR